LNFGLIYRGNFTFS